MDERHSGSRTHRSRTGGSGAGCRAGSRLPRLDRRRLSDLRALVDTSIFIAREQGRPLGELPSEVAVSVVTISELRYGVLAAEDHSTRAQRLSTLEAARRIGTPLGIDERVGDELARLRAALRSLGRSMKIMDAWIAAAALVHGAAVCTQDADFDVLQEAGLLDVMRA